MMSRNLPVLLLRSVRSIWRMLFPISIAVELATARMMALWLGTLAAPRGLARAVGLAGFMASIIPCGEALFCMNAGSWQFGSQAAKRGME